MEIQCSKPDCFWSGAPADAADHDCPTPDPALPLVADLPQDDTGTAAASGLPLFATKGELEHWLADHGVYDGQGNPANAETAEADRQYAIFLAADKAAAEPPPEPEIADEPEPAIADDEPWQITVAVAYQARDDYHQMRWLIVDEDAGELLDAYPIKAPAEASLIEWNHAGREASMWRASDVVKAAAALEDAEQSITAEPSPEPEPSKGSEPTAIEKLEQAAADAGGTLEIDETDVIEHPDEGALAGDLDDDDQAGEPITPAAREAVERLLEPDGGPDRENGGPDREPAPQPEPLFNAADYDKPGLQIPKVDGHAIDRISLKFGGGVMLDRSEPKDVSLYNRIHGQQTIELWIEAKWGGTGATPATNRDGDLDVIVGHKSLRVESIRIVDADQLGALEGLELVRAAARRASRAGNLDDAIEQAVTATLAETE